MTATERDRDLAWDLLLDAPQLTGEDRERAVRILAEAIAAERVRVLTKLRPYTKQLVVAATELRAAVMGELGQ